jgi:hypothetical protein
VQFIVIAVMSVMSGTFSHSYGVSLHDGELTKGLGIGHTIVMFIVIE